MSYEPYIDEFGCLITPARPEIPAVLAVPPRVDPLDSFAWNADADSAEEALSGDVYGEWEVGQQVGIVCGFARPPNEPYGTPFEVTHGFYHYTQDGLALVQPIEQGVGVGPSVLAPSGAVFRVARAGLRVSYFVNGALLYVSTALSIGAVRLAAHLFAAGDRIIDAVFAESTTVSGAARLDAVDGGALFYAGPLGLSATTPAVAFEAESASMRGSVLDTAPPPGAGLLTFWAGDFLLATDGGAFAEFRAAAGPTPEVRGLQAFELPATVEFQCASKRGTRLDIDLVPARAQLFFPFPGILNASDGGATAAVRNVVPPDIYLTLDRQRHAYLVVWVGNDFVTFSDSMILSDERIGLLILQLRERLGVGARTGGLMQLVSTFGDTLALRQALGIVWRVVVAEGFSLDGTLAATTTVLRTLVDTLLLHDIATGAREAIATLTASLVFGGNETLLWHQIVQDVLAMEGEHTTKLVALQRVIEALVLGDTSTPSMTVAALLRDGVTLSLTPDAVIDATVLLRDSLVFYARVTVDGQTYDAWLINTQSKGVARYTNYPFNSFAQLRGEWVGITDTGLYRLTGEDDDGEIIRASIRKPIEDFGNRRAKRMPSMYLGLAASGEMVLKTITTSQEGQRTEDWFLVQRGRADATREGRAKIARGIKSVMWGYELVNIDGGRFDIDAIEWNVLALDRRLT